MTSAVWTNAENVAFVRSAPRIVSEAAPTADLDLLRRIAAGDSGALGQFYDSHAPTLFALACRILTDAKEAEDVLQDVFLQLWNRAAAFDSAQGRPLAWVLTLTRNKAIDRLRATKRRQSRLVPETETETVEDYPSPSISAPDAARASEQGELVRSALAGLPGDQRRAIELAFFDGLTQTEIAAVLNEPLGTIKARIRRGMLKLRTELEQRL